MMISKMRWALFPWTESDSFYNKRMQRAAIVTTLAAVFVFVVVFSVHAGPLSPWNPLVDRLVQDGFEREYVESIFSEDLIFSPEIMARKMNVLLNTKLSAKREGAAPKPQVMDRYLNPMLIAGAYAFFREHRGTLDAIEKEYEVPGEVLVALMLVETKLGHQVGKHRAVTILSSMALGGNIEYIRSHMKYDSLSAETEKWLVRRTRQKGNWAYEELKALLTYAKPLGQDPRDIPSSMYGAIGLCQFIPTSAIHYGRDGTGDGKVDLFVIEDALYSMANFIRRHGWKASLDRAAKQKVIYRYNHSHSYAMTILAVADKIRKTDEFFGN